MAELPKNIRRPGGDLVSPKRPYGRRLLLPTEVELCEVLGISEDEYWIFTDQISTYNGQRPKGYELIPDIRSGALAAWAATETGKMILINLGIAIASTAIQYLLREKPKGPGGSRRTADVIGNTRFAPQDSFNSIQELANLGDPVPLVFANSLEENGYGGLRVNSQLLWSQFVSLGKYQQLKALALFSYGKIGRDPDYEGFAIGDSLLETYNAHKVGLYWKDGSEAGVNRIKESDRYLESGLVLHHQLGNDPFVIGIPDLASNATVTSKAFSGARNPTTQTAFGAFSPVPNAQICRLPYEFVRSSRGQEQDPTQDLARKRKKVEFARWPTRAGVLNIRRKSNNNEIKTKGRYKVEEGDTFAYQIVGTDTGAGKQIVYAGEAFNYKPHGVDDVDSMTQSIRESADDSLVVGEQYLFGTALVICTGVTSSTKPNYSPWVLETTKAYFFEVVEEGYMDIPINDANLGLHCSNPQWYNPDNPNLEFGAAASHLTGRSDRLDLLFSLNDQDPVYWQQYISRTILDFPRGTYDLYYGHDIYTGLKVALATVSNNRKCDVTEIGIKSTVFKRINFANVQSQPSQAEFSEAYWDRTQLTIGQVNTYANRISFFMLQARKLGDSEWLDLNNTSVDDHSGLFAVKGNTPEPQYNAITISHPTTDQYEFRFKPYPGNHLIRGNPPSLNKKFNLLSSSGNPISSSSYYMTHRFEVSFVGDEEYLIDNLEANNPEWQLGSSDKATISKITAATERNTGENQWESTPGAVVTRDVAAWRDFAVHKAGSGYNIVLWNETSNPSWSAGRVANGESSYMWQLYGIEGNPTLSGEFIPNLNIAWADISFWQAPKGDEPEKKFVPANPNVHYHPENNNHKFWVVEKHWTIESEQISPTFQSETVQEADGGHGVGLKFKVKVWKLEYDTNQYHYTVRWTFDDLGVGYKNNDQVRIPWTDASGATQHINVILAVTDVVITTLDGYGWNQDFNPYDAIADWNVYEGDENSNRNNPEHEIVYVNEIIKPKVEIAGDLKSAEYNNLAFAGIRINSSKEWANFSQLSAYFKQGIEIEKPSGAVGASNLFPEIAYALLTDVELGAGKLVGVESVDKEAMANAADFCKKNKFFWDSVISAKVNLRELIFEHASYCLLDFTIIGGKFSLKPSVPVKDNVINKTVKPDIKCLFTDGNISELQVTFLNAEERQPFRANVLYREEKPNGFPETKSLLIEEDNINSPTDPIETFDLSGFCTSEQQARYFAYFAMKSRRLIDHGLTFKTAPQYVTNLSPGDYFRLVSEVTHTSRFNNGAKLEDGTIVSKDDISGNPQVFYWVPGTEGVQPIALSQAPNGCLFTVKNTTTENKVYKCESISYVEDGLLEIAGSHAPVETNGQLSVMQGWGLTSDGPDGDFVINKNR